MKVNPIYFYTLKGVKIMNEEMNKYEELENEEIEEVGTNEEPETSRGGIVGKLIVGAVAVAAGAGALLYKNRDKLEKHRIHKLEKKGYIITKASDFVVEDKTVVSLEDEEEK